jgi:hypothetical protein
MKNLLKENDRNDIIQRIERISSEDKRLWGKMNVNEMLCHASDQVRLGLGEIKPFFRGNTFHTSFLKNLILLGMPAPKGKIETYKELKQGDGGTPPTDFENDRKLLLQNIEKFISKENKNENVIHPNFGKMNYNQWGRLIYIHLNHHLLQFGA